MSRGSLVMRGRRMVRLTVVVAVAAAALAALPGCSSTSGSGGRPASASSGSAVPDEDEPQVSPGPLSNVPTADVRAVTGLTLATARTEDEKGAAAVTKAVRTIVTDPVVRSVRRDGDRIGWVVTWTVPPATASSEMFRAQFAVQLVTVRGGPAARPRTARIDDTAVAVLDGKAPAAAWFDGTRPVLLVTEKGQDVVSLAAALTGKLPTG